MPRSDLPLKSAEDIFNQEVQQAVHELNRPSSGLFMSGMVAGFAAGLSVLAMGVLMTALRGKLGPASLELITAAVYGLGFIVAITARTDVFTEYTTMAILPVFAGKSSLSALTRVWSWIFLSNLLGAGLFALWLGTFSSYSHLIDPSELIELAFRLIEHPWHQIVLNASMAGWLMGLLSWLVIASRETISQILMIWLITFIIGLGHLHHVVLGTAEVLAGLFAGGNLGATDFLHFLLWTALGNVLGGVLFALMIHSTSLISGNERS